MSKVLALGTGPLLEKGVQAFGAQCLRTWLLVKPLLDAGHQVDLFTLPILTERPELQSRGGMEEKTRQGFRYQAFLNNDETFNLRRLEEACASIRPHCLLGINTYPSMLAAKLSFPAPLWADLNGWIMAEGQVKSAVYGNNSLLGLYWAVEEASLRRADKFSVISMRQFYALHGELAAVGRLNRHTFAYPFAEFMPVGYDPFHADPENRRLGRLRVRGALVPRNAFVLLWSGGYNSWTRLDVLIDALNRAMEVCPDLHYVSTGGAFYGHDELSYPRFEAMVRSSPYRERFHLLGWVDAAELPSLYAQANLGLSVDSRNFESMFGTRNRMINMMAAGVPMLTTLGTEIAETLVAEGCALGRWPDDPRDLAQGIAEAYRSRESLKDLGAKGRQFVLERYNCARTTAPLREWAARPVFAPDNQAKLDRAPGGCNPFLLATNPIEASRLAADSPPPASALASPGPFEKAKRAAERLIGLPRYAKWRFLRQEWLRRYWPAYRRRRAEIRAGRPGTLEHLTVFLTQACNAPCPQCGYAQASESAPGEWTLEEWTAVSRTLPLLDCLTIAGGEALLHPNVKEIAQILARRTRARTLRIVSNGMLPAPLEALCASLLEEGLPGVLEAWIHVDGLEATHNLLRRRERAWVLAQQSLAGLARLRGQNPGQFELGVLTPIHDKNYTELEPLNDWLRDAFDCRHRFEFIPSAELCAGEAAEAVRAVPVPNGLSLPPKESWDGILRTLKRINRRAGLPNHADHLALVFAARQLRRPGKFLENVSAGRNIGFIHGDGAVALCECSAPFGNLRDYGMDFAAAWASPRAEERRSQLRRCRCAVPACLAKNIEYTLAGQIAMLKDL